MRRGGKKKRAVGLWIGLGAGLLVLLGFGAAAAAGEPDDKDKDKDKDEDLDPFTTGELSTGAEPVVLGEVKPKVDPIELGELRPDEVPFDPGKHHADYPTGGKMYQVRKADIFFGELSNRSIIYRLLLTEGYLAAIDNGASDTEARAFAKKIAKTATLRTEYMDVISCAGINDAAYGTWGYGTKPRPGPHGRAIRLQKYHVNNRQRLTSGLPMQRNIELGDYMTAGDSSGTPIDYDLAEAYEYLFMPKLDRAALWNNKEIVVEQWDPPFAWMIGMPGDLVGSQWGCEGGEITVG